MPLMLRKRRDLGRMSDIVRLARGDPVGFETSQRLIVLVAA